MQNNQFKIISLFLVSLFIYSSTVSGQSFLRDIEVADSLFDQKKFTESFEIYKAIHETGEHVSPAMLLKMAYIREGLGDESGAMYYLNTYYLKTANDKVFGKMQELASQKELKGYEFRDQNWFFHIYYKYYYQLIAVLFAIIFLMVVILLIRNLQNKKRSYYAGIGVVVVSTLLFALVNFGNNYDKGILIKNNSYIMSAPSASADVLDISKAGHRVEILGEEDVWLQIQWGDQIGFVKNSYVKRLFF